MSSHAPRHDGACPRYVTANGAVVLPSLIMDTILALETSCDETTAAVIAGGRHILSNVVLTQEVLHRRFGGVVPELAAREHIRGIVPVVEQALRDAEVTWSDLAAVAVANGPGLAPALVVGGEHGQGHRLGARPPPDRGQPPGGPHLRELAREDPPSGGRYAAAAGIAGRVLGGFRRTYRVGHHGGPSTVPAARPHSR